jgi:hypothetical protein
MGYIQQSDTKKIYAYLTQIGKERFITGELVDFQVKYFSLHDDDINYYISAQNISASTYNTPKSGFISDITGDDDICLSNISEASLLKNKLVYFPPVVVQPGEYTVFTSCTDTIGSESFNVSVYKNPIPQGYRWFVKIDTISFPNSNSTINDAIVLTSTTSEKYPLNSTPKSFPASMKRVVPNGNGGFVTVLLDEKFLPREADAYNFTVNVVDALDNVVFTKEFKNINCSRKLFSIATYQPNILENPEFPTYTYTTTMPENTFLDRIGEYRINQKTGFAIWVIDNGNRRIDLNVTQEDLDIDYNGPRKYFFNPIYLDLNTNYNGTGINSNPSDVPSAKVFGFGSSGSISSINFDERYYNTNEYYPNTSTEGVITRPIFVRSPLMRGIADGSTWVDNAPTYTDNPSIVGTTYNNSLFTERYGSLHPTVKLFQDWKNGVEGFTMRYIEYGAIIKEQDVPKGSPTATFQLRGGYTNYSYLLFKQNSPNWLNWNADIHGNIYGPDYDPIGFSFKYCVGTNVPLQPACF